MIVRLPILVIILIGALFGVLFAPRAEAHDGPPYPVLVDESLQGWTFSVWADPDVGTGTFFYYLEPPDGTDARDVVVRVVSEPVDGSAPLVQSLSIAAEPDEPFQQVGELPFAHRGAWATRFVLESAVSADDGGVADAAVIGARAIELEVTPPGFGFFYALWFAIPFATVGALWLRALCAQRAYDRVARGEAPA